MLVSATSGEESTRQAVILTVSIYRLYPDHWPSSTIRTGKRCCFGWSRSRGSFNHSSTSCIAGFHWPGGGLYGLVPDVAAVVGRVMTRGSEPTGNARGTSATYRQHDAAALAEHSGLLAVALVERQPIKGVRCLWLGRTVPRSSTWADVTVLNSASTAVAIGIPTFGELVQLGVEEAGVELTCEAWAGR